MIIRHTPAYWIVWNGPGTAPYDGLDGFRRHARPIDLVRCKDAPPDSYPVLLCPARRNVKFTVPDVPSGKYVVAIYDGSEAGGHYTWGVIRVTAEGESRLHVRVAFAATAFLLVVAGVYGARRSIVQPPSPSRL